MVSINFRFEIKTISLFRLIKPGVLRIITCFILSVFFKTAVAQETLGIINSGYSGITGSVINPAIPVTSPFYIDVNLVSVDIFAENNYLYIAKEDYRFRNFFSKNPQFPTHGPDNQVAYDNYTTEDKKVYANVRMLGPSFSINVGRHSFGFITGARAVSSTKNVPYEIAKFIYTQLEFEPQYDINYIDNHDMYNAEMGWFETGFNYSFIFKQQSYDQWAAGITIKDLRGYAGGYLNTDNINYTVLDKDTLIVNNLYANAGYSLPIDYQSNDYMKDPLFRGKGVGFDIGIIYQKKKKYIQRENVSKLCSQRYVPYHYKIGVSLLDIGRIKFTENAQKLFFNDVSTYWPNLSNTSYTNVNDLTQLLSNQFYGNPNQLVTGSEIKIALPTAVSIQADVNYYKNWFINGTIVYPLQFSNAGIIRPVLFAVTPRYETRQFEVSLPISLYDWTDPRIGLSARYRGFFIGTEKLSGYFHYQDFTGIDFYAGLKFSLKKGNCRNKPGDACGNDEYRKFIKSKKEKKPRSDSPI